MSDCLPFSLVKGLMSEARLPAMENQSHIVPVRVGDPVHCKAVTDSHYGSTRCPSMIPLCRAARSACASRQRRFIPQISHLIAALKELWVACPVGKGQYIRLAAE